MSQQLLTNKTKLQDALNILQNKAAGSGEQATPVISVNSTNGLITATAGTKSSTHQLAFQPAKTITPSTTSQIAVSSGYYTGGNITVAAVPTQSKSVTPTSSAQNVVPDSGKFLSKVTVNAIPSTYVKPASTKGATTYTPTTANQTIASGTYLTGTQTIKGDSNLVASNIKSGVSIFGVSGTLVEGSGVSGEAAEWSENEDAIVTRTLSSYTNDRVKSIGYNAFEYCSGLKTVSFPACTSIGNDAFRGCYILTTVSFPACTTISPFAFMSCNLLTIADFPACTTIGSYAFSRCYKLTAANFPVCTIIGSYAFENCSGLTTVSFPACTGISSYAFENCSGLTTVSFPVCTSISGYAFRGCSNLTSVSFPVCTSIGDCAFDFCYNLTTVSFPACTDIGSYAFSRCYNLKSLCLTGSSICRLSHSNAFTSTPIGGYSASARTYGSIYVPASLLTSYQTATNWVYFSSYFSAIEDANFDDENSGDTGDIEPTIITFAIDGTEYQAEDGMTWYEWCDSNYNTGGFYIDDEGYVYNSEYWVWEDNDFAGGAEYKTYKILDKASYIFETFISW